MTRWVVDDHWPHRMPYRLTEGPDMSNNTVSEAVARPVRTGLQLGTAGVLTEFIDAFLTDLSDRQYIALAALITLVISWAQTLIENRAGVGFLRNVPPRRVSVVDDNDPGVGELGVILISAATAVVVLALYLFLR